MASNFSPDFTKSVHTLQVFKQKVLKKLYSAPPPERKIQEALTKAFKTQQEQEKEEERSKSASDSKDDAQIIPVSRKVYTVNLPPSGNEVCSTRLNEHHESQDSSEEPEEENSSQKFPRKRKRRRKLNSSLLDHIKKNVPSVFQQQEESKIDILHTLHLDSAKPGAETLTKNRKRKLKKKRHKERLKAAGLAPRATAVEFMYEPREGSSEEGPAKSEEVDIMDFLNAM
ncbi:glutamate-rich protein 1 isoform X2 [Rhincodon typus]|uniref:glutamate-rich protein 1 isoform X2 n=1 Tax=Rhincodon typus TaxID=259920 RepID=UPI00202DF592|nr:glutamate-rich protein 1 isoform X2 [Rhincodon typus]